MVGNLLEPFWGREVLWTIWKDHGEGSNRYTYICPVLLSGSTYYHPVWFRHMGSHYTQYPGIWVCVMLGGGVDGHFLEF